MHRLSDTEPEQWREVKRDGPTAGREAARGKVLTFSEYLEFLRFAERFAPAQEERGFITGGEHWKL